MKPERLYSYKVVLLNASWIFLLTQSILVPFFSGRGLSLSQIFILQVVHALILLVFDVPTSYLADKYGRKKILIAAAIFRGLGGTMFFFADNFLFFICTYILIGLGNSMFSGAGIAVLFNNVSTDQEAQTILSWNYKLSRISAILSLFLGSIIATISIGFAVGVNVLTAWIPLLILLTIKHVSTKTVDSKATITEAIKNFKSDALPFWPLIFISAICASIPVVNLYFGQELFGELNYSIYWYGIFVSGAQIITIFITQLSAFSKPKVSLLIYFIALTVLTLYLLFSFKNIVCFGIAILLSEFIRLFSQTYLTNLLNKAILNQHRATINSIVNFASTLIVFLIGLFVSMLLKKYNSQAVSLSLAIIFSGSISAVSLMLILNQWRLRKCQIQLE